MLPDVLIASGFVGAVGSPTQASPLLETIYFGTYWYAQVDVGLIF
jgi:hypothetical protein